jgi:hypothetical protein
MKDRRQWDGKYGTYDEMRAWMGGTDTEEGFARGINILSKPRRMEFTFLSVRADSVVTVSEGQWIGQLDDGTFAVVDPPEEETL